MDENTGKTTANGHAKIPEVLCQLVYSPTGMNFIAGLSGVVAGHPFDTVKVRLQSQSHTGTPLVYRSTLHCFATIVKNEGGLGLFKGMASPLVGVATINALLFGVYGFLLDVQQKYWPSEGAGNTVTISQVFWAGCGSGLANSLISCPTELAKIQLQNQVKDRRFNGPWQCLKHIWRSNGFLGIYRGLGATILRETPSYGVYFAIFEALGRAMSAPHRRMPDAELPHAENGERIELSGMQLLLAGGISGVAGWMSTYPIDVAKTKIQAQGLEALTYKTTFGCLRAIVREEGWKVLFRGGNATIIRAFPTNAVIFWAYSWSMRELEDAGRRRYDSCPVAPNTI